MFIFLCMYWFTYTPSVLKWALFKIFTQIKKCNEGVRIHNTFTKLTLVTIDIFPIVKNANWITMFWILRVVHVVWILE